MASLVRQKTGRGIQFRGADGKRRTLRLGRMTTREASAVLVRVERLIACRAAGEKPTPELRDWVAGLDVMLQKRIVAVGLIDRPGGGLFRDLAERYLASKRGGVKASTLTRLGQSMTSLNVEIGNRTVRSLTRADADAVRVAFLKTFSEATTRKRLSDCRSVLRHAVRDGLRSDNPFDEVAVSAIATTRHAWVSAATARDVMDVLPSSEWRLLFALARWGGLRIPSEPLLLRWGDVDWDRKSFNVIGKGSAIRRVPLFPELAGPMRDAFEAAAAGEAHVVPMLQNRTGASLRKPLMAAIRRAGHSPWPRLYHNLRSSRQTELTATFPLHQVCKWLGNTPRVAAQHYLQVLDDDFDRASSEPTQNPTRHPAALQGNARQTMPGNGNKVHETAPSGSSIAPPGIEPGPAV